MAYFLSFERITRLAILSAVGLGAAQARAEQPNLSPLRTHGPIEVHRLEDGSLARGPHNEFMTSNWSGYAIAHYQTGRKIRPATSDFCNKIGTRRSSRDVCAMSVIEGTSEVEYSPRVFRMLRFFNHLIHVNANFRDLGSLTSPPLKMASIGRSSHDHAKRNDTRAPRRRERFPDILPRVSGGCSVGLDCRNDGTLLPVVRRRGCFRLTEAHSACRVASAAGALY